RETEKICMCLFFFSSRRRHTRSKRDWSSDVCSSDLPLCRPTGRVRSRKRRVPLVELAHARSGDKGDTANVGLIALKPEYYPILEIGRASCRERVESWGGAAGVETKSDEVAWCSSASS